MGENRTVQDDLLNPIQSIKIRGANGDFEVLVDEVHSALTMIPVFHAEIHLGNAYTASSGVISVDNNADLDMVITTGSKSAHITFHLGLGGDSQIFFYENPDVGSGGTLIAPVNRNRNSSNTPEATILVDPIINGTGTLLLEDYDPSGSGPQALGTVGGDSSEFDLKPNEDYLLRITNISGQAQNYSERAEWYEEEPF